ncbi:mitogen-activated protein kinase kinase kinase kinase 3-like [Notothenia coriiceps]|uniref:Mitogen-activated protein kinase kinase kinase kinase 3-like n=1 Tax=Notothenia coriiceps TaxID=8208 RepID=A0A6I9NQF6_9TELE|nr:PREDICTED: mitogen-activated protein kinase kinase kinase kinase 3-like [Notothenia coriiceps]
MAAFGGIEAGLASVCNSPASEEALLVDARGGRQVRTALTVVGPRGHASGSYFAVLAEVARESLSERDCTHVLKCACVAPRSDPHPTIPVIVGSYTLVILTTLSARNIRTSEVAAIKIVKLDPGDDITSIQQEITMMRECKHKNIVSYFGSYHRNTKLWICMEYCGGGSLQDMYHEDIFQNHSNVVHIDSRVAIQLSAVFQKSESLRCTIRAIGRKTTAWSNHIDTASYHLFEVRYGCNPTFKMAPEVAAVEKKGGYNHLCDIWAVGITAIELAELQPPMFDLHPMRALMLMSKSNFQPPRLKDKSKWSAAFQSFVKMALIKNPRKRPSAETLLQHPFVTQLLTRNLVIELLDMANNPELHNTHTHSMDDNELEVGEVAPDKIQSAGKHLPVERTLSEEQCENTPIHNSVLGKFEFAELMLAKYFLDLDLS